MNKIKCCLFLRTQHNSSNRATTRTTHKFIILTRGRMKFMNVNESNKSFKLMKFPSYENNSRRRRRYLCRQRQHRLIAENIVKANILSGESKHCKNKHEHFEETKKFNEVRRLFRGSVTLMLEVVRRRFTHPSSLFSHLSSRKTKLENKPQRKIKPRDY